jgi:predicted RNA-binding Zn-ribbon protein involved in translation (DUF1610 family)
MASRERVLDIAWVSSIWTAERPRLRLSLWKKGPEAEGARIFAPPHLVERFSKWEKRGKVDAGKAKFSYYCTSCETRHTSVLQGTCPTCGSQAIVPVGWYRRSPDERKEWFRRIRGEPPTPSGKEIAKHEHLKKTDKTEG